jgi:hypothetical protein
VLQHSGARRRGDRLRRREFIARRNRMRLVLIELVTVADMLNMRSFGRRPHLGRPTRPGPASEKLQHQ